jgi:hypothetical protein
MSHRTELIASIRSRVDLMDRYVQGGAPEELTEALEALQRDDELLKKCRQIAEWHASDGDDCGILAREVMREIDQLFGGPPA